ncbi:dihydrofolate reductase family protein [Catalinimonas niigatensis]|uniref:dihydrofolate reductase family protein n=1 Tax=Catalinimonas niigatensis TaxID=1397264 RepID=UPI0026666BAE|nr:dihydrofolate reductase family protein [Catalinimonas niigatensis]WPP53028.1 dihydrofolate reductase family protein [Catalinimonas niigatensis]
MRKLKLQMQLTIDSFVAGPQGEMDWMQWNWDEALKDYVEQITDPVDCILLGRKLAEGFIPHWTSVAANPDDPEFSAGKKFTETQKVIFTKSLDRSVWDNSILAKGELADEVSKLKSQAGKDMIVYGGSQFVSALIKENLIDEYHLFINPAAIGNGMTIFAGLEQKRDLKLAHARSFDCGVVVLCYEPDKV